MAQRLIDANALVETMTSAGAITDYGKYIIEHAPAVNVAPVGRGKWVDLGFIGDKEMVGCPVCHCVSETRSDFCKDCGAKMDLEE